MAVSQWVAVVPAKRLAAAKRRLRGAVGDPRHGELALAMLCDTLSAALACGQVAEAVVVTDDPVIAAAARSLGARPVPDPIPGAVESGGLNAAVESGGLNAAIESGPLNAAIEFGADVAAGLHRWRVVLAGDLPGLRPAELSAVLQLAAATPARHFLPDAAGTGTVLLTAPPGVALRPRFGTASAAAHAASGARRLAGDFPALRRDVDTPDDLRAVLTLGAGPRTTRVLADEAGRATSEAGGADHARCAPRTRRGGDRSSTGHGSGDV
ncbi:MAG TPA: 2-phospho-L-lactate guanylyltransferase [Actinoplanes sp.]|nr:2-phospho-L-lactate guanylyltransferase [Actinoplanes sp.]